MLGRFAPILVSAPSIAPSMCGQMRHALSLQQSLEGDRTRILRFEVDIPPEIRSLFHPKHRRVYSPRLRRGCSLTLQGSHRPWQASRCARPNSCRSIGTKCSRNSSRTALTASRLTPTSPATGT
eukprot:6162764-Pyramimonas_sp.AAC.4